MKAYCINCGKETEFIIAYINIEPQNKTTTLTKYTGKCAECEEYVCRLSYNLHKPKTYKRD